VTLPLKPESAWLFYKPAIISLRCCLPTREKTQARIFRLLGLICLKIADFLFIKFDSDLRYSSIF